MNRIFLYVHTLRYLKWKQIAYRLWYFLKKRGSHRFLQRLCSKDKDRACAGASRERRPPLLLRKNGSPNYFEGFSSPFLPAAPCYHQGAFTFLNRSKAFPARPRWSFAECGKLWTYHLNYFAFLNQPDMSREVGLELISSFLAGTEGNRVGAEPFPISLRGMNWIKFLIRWGIRDEAVDSGLYRQYRHLLGNLEYHLLGNHLLENGFSLLFGACYFGDERFYRKAAEILRKELAEQILPDGGHFERSPMYHQIILGRVLDCINLLRRYVTVGMSNNRSDADSNITLRQAQGNKVSWHSYFDIKDLTRFLEEKAVVMLAWLEQMTFRNGSIPLMNDAAFGMSPTTAVLADYAGRLGVTARSVSLKESGYRKIVNNIYEAVLDVGNIGPDYIPGHAHADTLSFELHVGGIPVIVDSGTSTYEDCPQRHWQRSTRAHNTVEIDGQDQSEVWGNFRVARRARVTELKESMDFVEATHDGYRRLPGNPLHTREWRFSEKSVQIRDNISGGFQEAVGRFHFHPDVRIEIHSDACRYGMVHLSNEASLSWQIVKGRGHFAETTYYPEFNISIPNRCLEVRFEEPETVVEFVLSKKNHLSSGSG